MLDLLFVLDINNLIKKTRQIILNEFVISKFAVSGGCDSTVVATLNLLKKQVSSFCFGSFNTFSQGSFDMLLIGNY